MAPSPLAAVSDAGVSEPLVRALLDREVSALTPVQEACLPHCLAGKDVLAKAKTGTGKTLGFCIPTCERLLRSQAAPKSTPGGVDPIRAVILSSTRELATQITTQAQQLLTHTNFNVEEILGGASITNQRERLDPKINGFAFKYGGIVDLMIATPGRLLEHIESTDGFCERLSGVEVLVLDEVDMLLDGGFQRAIEAIIAKLPKQRQTLCFSATVPAKLLPVLHLAMKDDHVVVDCVGEEEVDTHAKIEQAVVVHPLEHSLLALYQSILDEIERRPDDYKIIAFLPTARATQFNTAVMKNMNLNVMEIHSRASQGERTLVSDTFRNKTQMILLSSDVSARGVDYPDITLVLQVSGHFSHLFLLGLA
jgi:ATP-dependent RNA helicase MSS116